ncbi:MAG: OsmC family protein [Thermoplasmata archaeon]
MQAVATWRKGHEILLKDGRTHSVLVDLSPDEGGTSAGTTPLELSLLALAGSLASTFVTLARKRHLDFSGLTVVLEGDAPSPTAVIGGVHGSLRLRSRADRNDVEATLRASLDLCPVGRIFREARVPVNVIAVVAVTGRSP